MFQISDLLQKFKSIQDPKQVRQGFVDVINDICSFNLLTTKSLEIRNNVIWIKVNPAIRQRIFQKKDICLQKIKDKFPDQSIVDIR